LAFAPQAQKPCQNRIAKFSATTPKVSTVMLILMSRSWRKK